MNVRPIRPDPGIGTEAALCVRRASVAVSDDVRGGFLGGLAEAVPGAVVTGWIVAIEASPG
jgi:hypothetical protein